MFTLLLEEPVYDYFQPRICLLSMEPNFRKRKERRKCVIYSRLSLFRLRLSRITAYLEEKIWSLFKHRNLTSGNKILWIGGAISLLPTSLITYSFGKVGIFLNSENLICRSTDTSKYFRGSLQLRDNESRLYIKIGGRRTYTHSSFIYFIFIF